MSYLSQLTQKLREIFQTDRADLDFGIYRILNSRSEQINDYLNRKLPQKVQRAFNAANQGQIEQWQKALDEAIKQAQDLGVNPQDSAKVQNLKAQIAQAKNSGANSEAAVFSHLYTFFSRYYDEGDFISQRRYKGDTYAIPYSGEEVLLHWANKDQYYTKSGENFSNYRFKLADGREVFFRLIAADTAKDNRKDNEAKRLFTLATKLTIAQRDDEGNDISQTIEPLVVSAECLEIRFEYRPADKKEKQEQQNIRTLESLKALIPADWQAVWAAAPTEKNPNRTLLEKQLSDYTQKNSADYFIHKDLGGFLRRELDFYIKNEVMNLDNIQHADSFAHIENSLRQIQVLREIAHDIIDFLAQLEDFQKKLWLKKKFVANTHYLITLDRIPQAMLEQTIANKKQQQAWKNLFNFNVLDFLSGGGDFADQLIELQQHQPHLVIDTSLYPPAYQQQLLTLLTEEIDLDEHTDGVLIHSDNFQALNLLQARYREQVKCIYIDPPYNAKSSEILYKNSYKHSSWMTLMENRLVLGANLLTNDAVSVIAIDENENSKLLMMLEDIFSDMEITSVSIVHNPTGQQGNNFSFTHEFSHFIYPKNKSVIGLEDRKLKNRDSSPDIRPLRNVSSGANHLRASAKNCFYPIFIKDNIILGFGDVSSDDFHPPKNVIRDDGVIEVYPIDPKGIESKWVFARDTVESIVDELTAEFNKNKKEWDIIRTKSKFRYKSLWSDKRYSANSWGSAVLNNIIPNSPFDYPKSIFTVRDAIDASLGNMNYGIVLDYFAGSGTTAHAVINLNREDGGKRKYILVEQGEYFDTVLKPRVQKVIYSENWKNGKPQADEKTRENPYNGVSQIVKVLKLESYEDTLNNLQLKAQSDLFKMLPEAVQEDYLLRYLLDTESKGSLLNSDDFQHPFDYRLNIATDSAGAYQSTVIDLPETFSYLLGIRVQQITDEREKRGYLTIEGLLPNDARCLIVWRDCEKMGYAEVAQFFDKHNINPNSKQYDVIYLNGDHDMANQWQNEDGSESRLALRAIEPEFLNRMFAQ
ncbi:site-specific DNA-methyltransferase [Gallibacterium anatis]|uniref:site-specific DNA-methyltransferase n=1 Tax=Gallibacterium anatis TaxID=750 RepID=UPI0039FC96B0